MYNTITIKEITQQLDGTLHTEVDIERKDGSIVTVATISGWTEVTENGEKRLETDIHFNTHNLFQDDHFLDHIRKALRNMEEYWREVQKQVK